MKKVDKGAQPETQVNDAQPAAETAAQPPATEAAAPEKAVTKGKGKKASTKADKPATQSKREVATDKKVNPGGALTVRSVVRDEMSHLVDERLAKLLSQTEQRATVPLIFSSIRNVMRAVQPLAKTHEHPDQGFDFRKIDEICTRLQPLLVEHGLFYAPEVLEHHQIERTVNLPTGESWVNIFSVVKVAWYWYAMDGSTLPKPIITMGEGVSEFQHSTAAAQTMSEKTMLCDVFQIPVFGDRDPEEADTLRSQASTAPATQKEIYTAPAAITKDASERTLFDVDVPEPTGGNGDSDAVEGKGKRRGKKDAEAQTSVAAGAAAAALDEQPAESDKPISAGFVRIMLTNMKAKKLTETQVCHRFGLAIPADFKEGEALAQLPTSKMNEALAWINAQKGE